MYCMLRFRVEKVVPSALSLAAVACCGKLVMPVQLRTPVDKVPVLSKATVLHAASASKTLPPLISMPLQPCKCAFTH